jgi:uridine phosphorylase
MNVMISRCVTCMKGADDADEIGSDEIRPVFIRFPSDFRLFRPSFVRKFVRLQPSISPVERMSEFQSRRLGESEFILNSDGSIFHLHLLPHQISSSIILVGDPDRVSLVGSLMSSIEFEIQNREFHTITGYYNDKRISVVSHGIGPDNIDIVINELDALVNIDFETRTVKPILTSLTLIRVGTSGSLQPDLQSGSYSIAEISIGLDTVLHYYSNADSVIDSDLSQAFMKHLNWNPKCGEPYAVHADSELVQRFYSLQSTLSHEFHFHRGITIAAVGFYGPQGRELRLPVQSPETNSLLTSFRYGDLHIANYEMESGALAGLGKLLGHKVLTICCVINNRLSRSMDTSYKGSMQELLQLVLENIC